MRLGEAEIFKKTLLRGGRENCLPVENAKEREEGTLAIFRERGKNWNFYFWNTANRGSSGGGFMPWRAFGSSFILRPRFPANPVTSRWARPEENQVGKMAKPIKGEGKKNKKK